MILLISLTSYSKIQNISLRQMFYNPINLNIASHKELSNRLRLLSLSEHKIQLFIIFLKNTARKHFKSFREILYLNIFTQEDITVISHFFILNDKDAIYLFENDREDEYYISDEGINDPDNKININRFRKDSLLNYSFINENMVQAILRYRKEFGRFNSIYQLLLIPEISRETFIRLKPYLAKLKQDIPATKSSIELRYKHDFKPIKPDKTNSDYFFTRIKLHLDRGFEFNISANRTDGQVGYYPGGIFSTSYNNLRFYRQYSMSLYIDNKISGFDFIAIGDYSLRFGQHLLFGSAFPNFIYNIDHSPIKKSDLGIRKYSNPNRTGALRGLAFTLSHGIIDITPFIFINEYELKNNRFLKTGVNINIESLVTDSSLVSDDKSLSQRLIETGAGFNIRFKLNKMIKIGFNLVQINFSDLINPTIKDSNDIPIFRGKDLLLSSVYFDLKPSKVLNIFSEIAISTYKDTVLSKQRFTDMGSVLGSILNFNKMKYSILARYLGIHFHSPHSSQVIEERRDEMGIFQGIYFKIYRELSMTLYLDLFRKIDNPKLGKDLAIKLYYKIKPDLLLYYLYNITYKSYYSTFRVRKKHQGNLEYWFTENISIRLRYENISSKRDDNQIIYQGDLLFTQFKMKMFKKLLLLFSITYYTIDDFESAVYLLESNLPYWYDGIASFSDRGIKYNILLLSKSESISFGVKYSIDDRKSPLENRIVERLYFQLIYKW